jgi:hypothetical protein
MGSSVGLWAPRLFAAKFLGPFLLRIPAGEFSTRAGKQDFSAANINSSWICPYRRRGILKGRPLLSDAPRQFSRRWPKWVSKVNLMALLFTLLLLAAAAAAAAASGQYHGAKTTPWESRPWRSRRDARAAGTLGEDEDPYAQNRLVLARNLARRFDATHGLLA